MLSSSWPLPASPSMEANPPQAPQRKPSDADWEVPPLRLPNGPVGKRRSVSASSTRTGQSSQDAGGTAVTTAATEDEEDDTGIFRLDDEGNPLDTYVGESAYEFLLDGMDTGDSDASPVASAPRLPGTRLRERAQTCINSVSTKKLDPGASPALLTALEEVAEEVRSGRRVRSTTL
eukprot:TRINITY_DN37098_c0_g1_i1.p1 TRINITY_DN37098_c0_g1~~TRINITY_DN37098_c0_g1_i1.p1  ORF type:complete len:176 (+),score=24.26 TRINITY_DN37098_c0_g1_i1:75-602(+)